MTNNPLEAETKKIQRTLEKGRPLSLDDMNPDLFRGYSPGTVIIKQIYKIPEIIIIKGEMYDVLLLHVKTIRGVQTNSFNVDDLKRIGFDIVQIQRIGLEPEMGTETYRQEEAVELIFKLRSGSIVTIDLFDPIADEKQRIRLGRSLALVGKENYQIGLLISPAIIRKISNTSKNTPATIEICTNKIVSGKTYTDRAMSDSVRW